LSKTEFSDLIGVRNAFRRDISGIGYKIISGITKYFPEVTIEWLLTKHDTKEFETLNFTPRKMGNGQNTNESKDRKVLELEEKVRQLEARMALVERILTESRPEPGRRFYDPLVAEKK